MSTTTAIPQRRPVFDKLRTSALKRHVRLVRWIARMRGHYKTPLRRRYFGADFVVMPDEAIDEEIAIKRYEWWELSMTLMACRRYRPEAFIDVGANIGLYTCVLGKAQAPRKLLAFEPDPRNFVRLSESIARNGLVGVVDAHPIAVGAAKSTASLILGTAGNCALTKLGDAGPHAPSVDVIALDDLLDIRNSMICVKIDVEGYEIQVLAGAAILLRSNGGYAQIECHGDKRPDEVTKIMTAYGWHLVGRHDLNLVFDRRLD
jgi:FkbM family methyltransferase